MMNSSFPPKQQCHEEQRGNTWVHRWMLKLVTTFTLISFRKKTFWSEDLCSFSMKFVYKAASWLRFQDSSLYKYKPWSISYCKSMNESPRQSAWILISSAVVNLHDYHKSTITHNQHAKDCGRLLVTVRILKSYLNQKQKLICHAGYLTQILQTVDSRLSESHWILSFK